MISISRKSSLYRCRPESLSIALPLEDTAHEHLQRTSVELCPGHCALPSSLPVQSEHLSQFVLSGGSRAVDLVAEDEDGTVAQLLVSQQRLQLHFALPEPGPVAAVHQEDDGVHSWEIILPHPPGLVMATKIKSGESEVKKTTLKVARCW